MVSKIDMFVCLAKRISGNKLEIKCLALHLMISEK
jgi:hypothetical protein